MGNTIIAYIVLQVYHYEGGKSERRLLGNYSNKINLWPLFYFEIIIFRN